MKRTKVGAITFCCVIFLNFLFAKSPTLYELAYFDTFYQLIRIIHDYTLGFIPIPSLYIISPLFFYYFFKDAFGSFKDFGLALFTCSIWIINLFYILWGFNYNQSSIYEVLELPATHVDSTYIHKAFVSQTQVINGLYPKSILRLSYSEQEIDIRSIQENLLDTWQVPTFGRVRVRKIPAGSLLHFRTSGIYIPHAIEGHIDNGLYYKQLPFTIAHEMAHGYGFTDESVCNFIAYLCCVKSENFSTRYSAELAYWRYLGSYFKYYFPEEWEIIYDTLDKGIIYDLEEIKSHISRFKDLMPIYRDLIYDKFLKQHGVEAGLRSYNQMILLIAAYEQKEINSSSDQ